MSRGGSLHLRLPRRRWERVRLFILNRDGWRCVKCAKASRLEVHHKIALENGGTNDPSNLTTLCQWDHVLHHRLERIGKDRTEWRRFAAQNKSTITT